VSCARGTERDRAGLKRRREKESYRLRGKEDPRNRSARACPGELAYGDWPRQKKSSSTLKGERGCGAESRQRFGKGRRIGLMRGRGKRRRSRNEPGSLIRESRPDGGKKIAKMVARRKKLEVNMSARKRKSSRLKKETCLRNKKKGKRKEK